MCLSPDSLPAVQANPYAVDIAVVFSASALRNDSSRHIRHRSLHGVPAAEVFGFGNLILHPLPAKALDFPEFNDTISIGYTSEPKFVSEECGAMYCYNIDTVAHTCHFIDSVSVLEPYIDNIDVMRLKIYFRTTADDDTPEEDDNESDEPHL